MSGCTARLAGGPLVCVRADEHLTGHTFEASWAADAERDEETVKPKRAER